MKTNLRRSGLLPRRRWCADLRASAPSARRSPSIFHASRVAIDSPTNCECCGSNRLRKLGEDVTRTLECSPRQWEVVEAVREKFSCRDCEKISQVLCPGTEIVALRWLRTWCRPRRRRGDPHHDDEAQRRRSASLAR